MLDLRRPELQASLLLRHRLAQRARRTLSDLGFLEIETPILTKPTPEGARDYLVPSRVHEGEFYALPQSPQIYKQLLMVAGYDRYFQIARCFRDEDLRADRQPEFTQIDVEASFVAQEDVQGFIEQVLVAMWDEAGEEVAAPFRRLSYREAMERYGIDKPDLRFGFEIQDFTSLVQPDAAPFVHEALAKGGRVRGILAGRRRQRVAQGDRRAHRGGEGRRRGRPHLGAPRERRLGRAGREGDRRRRRWRRSAAAEGDLLLAVPGRGCGDVAGAARGAHAADAAARASTPSMAHAFCWVVDFPLFEKDPATGERIFVHHPFTSPHVEDIPFLDSDPFRCRALHYDAVYNGNELGSGSIRITDPALQQKIFGLLGIGPDEIRRRFGFLLDGLAAGAPPHGGFAIGFDRVAMLLSGRHVAARRDRVPEDDRGAGAVRGRADAGGGAGADCAAPQLRREQ